MADGPLPGNVPGIVKHYRLTRQLGAGGMGMVFEAFDRRDDSRVAVKLLYQNLAADPSFRERFEREAHVAALLRSPYTVHILDYGLADGYYFLAMEFVEGQSLAELIREGPVEPGRALRIAADVARALEEAGVRGVVHRDIKPDNVLIASDGTVKVADFGIARQMSSSGLTVPGGFVGTALYAAPEQASGEADPRADIYALGCTLFAMLTGRPPFTGSPLEILRQHTEAPFPAAALGSLPDPIVNLVRRCMEKDPADRYKDASELSAALDRATRAYQAMVSRQTGGRAAAAAPGPATPAPQAPVVLATEVAGMPAQPTAVSPTAPDSVPPASVPPAAPGTAVMPPFTPPPPTTAVAMETQAAGSPAASEGESEAKAAPAAPPASGGKRPVVMIAGIAGGLVALAGTAFVVMALFGGGGGSSDDDTPLPTRRPRTPTPAEAAATLVPVVTPSNTAQPTRSPSPGPSASPTAAASPTNTAAVPSTSTPTTRPPTSTATSAPRPATPTPTVPPIASIGITAGRWDYSFTVTSNNCGFGLKVGEIFDVSFDFIEVSAPDQFIAAGERITITESDSGLFIGNFTFTYPAFTFNYPVTANSISGTASLSNIFTGRDSGTANLRETYGSCTIVGSE